MLSIFVKKYFWPILVLVFIVSISAGVACAEEHAVSIDIGTNVTALIEKLASAIGVTSDKVFPWYMKETVLRGYTLLASLSFLVLISMLATWIGFHKLSKIEDSYGRGNSAWWVPALGGSVVAIIAMFLLLLGSGRAYREIANPEYHAMKAITSDMSELLHGNK